MVIIIICKEPFLSHSLPLRILPDLSGFQFSGFHNNSMSHRAMVKIWLLYHTESIVYGTGDIHSVAETRTVSFIINKVEDPTVSHPFQCAKWSSQFFLTDPVQ